MKAIQITEFGGPEKMSLIDIADPVPGDSEVLLDVLKIGINYADTHQVENSYLSAQTLPLIPGVEVVGRTPDGKRVLALVSSGGYAEKATAHKGALIPIPDAISDEDALRLVRARGIEMAKSAALSPAGMSAVLGGDREVVLKKLEELKLVAANDNGGGQIVAAGDLAALAALSENPPEGARVRALAVAGAFHTSFMEPAVEPLRTLAATIQTAPTTISVISNKDGEVVSDGGEVLTRIVNQIANPVRWDLCMQRLKNLGVTGVIELPPAGTLVGLLKRGAPEIETFALKSADDLSAAKEFAGRHA